MIWYFYFYIVFQVTRELRLWFGIFDNDVHLFIISIKFNQVG